MGKVLGVIPSKWALPLGIVFLLALGFGTGWGSHGFSVSSVQTNVGNVGGGGVSPTPNAQCFLSPGTSSSSTNTVSAVLDYNDNPNAPHQSISGYLYGDWNRKSGAGTASGTGIAVQLGTSGTANIVGRASGATGYWDAVYNLQAFCVASTQAFTIPIHASSGVTSTMLLDSNNTVASTSATVNLDTGVDQKVNFKISANTTNAYDTNPAAGKVYYALVSNDSSAFGTSTTIAPLTGYTSCAVAGSDSADAGLANWNKNGFAAAKVYVCQGVIAQSVTGSGGVVQSSASVQADIYPGDLNGGHTPAVANTTMYILHIPANAYDVGAIGSNYAVQFSGWYLNGTVINSALVHQKAVPLGT